MNMVIDLVNDLFKDNCDNYDEVKGYFLVSSMYRSRTPSLSLSNYDEDYATRVQRESDRMIEDNHVTPTNSP